MANGTSLAERRKAAGIYPRVKMERLAAASSFTVTATSEETAMLPDGTESQGIVASWVDNETGEMCQTFVGGVALCRELRQLDLPFTARLTKIGRTWVFADAE